MVNYESVEIMCMIWNIIILGTTTYLVFWKNASGWWFLLAYILLRFPDNKLFFECEQRNKSEQRTSTSYPFWGTRSLMNFDNYRLK